MPNFDLAPRQVFSTSDISLAPWTDPAREPGTLDEDDPGAPSRLNAREERPQLYYQVTPGVLQFAATVDGVEAPLDANPVMAGETFQAWNVEHPPLNGPAIAQPAGQSSVANVTLAEPGHYCVGFRTPLRGAVLFHFDVVPA